MLFPLHSITYVQINEKNDSISGDMVNSYRSLRVRYLRSITFRVINEKKNAIVFGFFK